MEYEIIRSERKTIAAQIKQGRLIVRAPRRVSERQIEDFLAKHRRWIEKNMKKEQERQEALASVRRLTDEEICALKEKARKVIPARVAYFAPLVGVTYGRITIRNQKTRWGSCSAKGNLNFNCLLMLAPEDVLDSVIVHELCHRKHMNHSKAFYAEVYQVFPEYDRCQAWLKKEGEVLMRRMIG